MVNAGNGLGGGAAATGAGGGGLTQPDAVPIAQVAKIKNRRNPRVKTMQRV
jgi:hypothetical protein